MAEVRVTREFKENFDLWATDVVDQRTWTKEEIDGLKGLMREYELADGPDRLRDKLVFFTPEGQEQPAAIDDPKERFQYWNRFFAEQAHDIRRRQLLGAGVSDRMRKPMRKAA